jgi:hypothetical protein
MRGRAALLGLIVLLAVAGLWVRRGERYQRRENQSVAAPAPAPDLSPVQATSSLNAAPAARPARSEAVSASSAAVSAPLRAPSIVGTARRAAASPPGTSPVPSPAATAAATPEKILPYPAGVVIPGTDRGARPPADLKVSRTDRVETDEVAPPATYKRGSGAY